MAKEICCEALPALTVYGLLRRETDGFFWNGTAFETYATAHLSTYVIALSQVGSSGIYTANFPAGVAAGEYTVSFRIQAAGAAAESDAKGMPQTLSWNGAAIAQSVYDASGNLAATVAAVTPGAITSASFTVAPVAGVATGILEMIAQLWRRFFRKAILDNSATTLKTYADDGTTVLTTQSVVVSGNTETQGPAS